MFECLKIHINGSFLQRILRRVVQRLAFLIFKETIEFENNGNRKYQLVLFFYLCIPSFCKTFFSQGLGKIDSLLTLFDTEVSNQHNCVNDRRKFANFIRQDTSSQCNV